MSRSLSRGAGDGRPAAPVRLLHLGLGNFYRAHQAWYTEHASDAADWGYVAFTGRSGELATTMGAQDGLYTLLVRGRDGDAPEVVSSIVEVHPGPDGAAWLAQWRNPELAVVTITVTEAGYCRSGAGGIDLENEAVAADVEALRAGRLADVTSAPARLLAGMIARRDADAGPLTVLSCDNLPHNGDVVREVVRSLADAVEATLVALVDSHSFATSMVDRITPRTTDTEIAVVREQTGVEDPATVVTEPFHEWVVRGEFVAGRPDWESAGAVFVDDVEPFEQRKLWLLNGSHTLMAYAASARGHETVCDAIHDEVVRGWVEAWWDEASAHLSVPSEDYRAALIERYENPSIRHLLAQIAGDGSQKVPVRILPTLRREREQGRSGEGAARVVAAWVNHLRGAGAPVNDAAAGPYLEAAAAPELADAVRGVLERLDPALASDAAVVDLVVRLATELQEGDPA